MIKRYSILIVLTIFMISSRTSSVMAQKLGLYGVGGRLSFVDPENPVSSTIGFGGHVHLGEIIEHLALYPSLEYWSKSDFSSFSINGDMRYYFNILSNLKPFAGGGLAILFTDFRAGNDTDIGLNFLGGVDFPVAEKLVVTAKIKFLISDIDVLKITGGVTYLLGQ